MDWGAGARLRAWSLVVGVSQGLRASRTDSLSWAQMIWWASVATFAPRVNGGCSFPLVSR
jgi:hypothetical protein